jgi:phosphatidylserine decarboxylase
MHIDMREAKIDNIDGYPTFNAFFTRELKCECRPVENDPSILISPADGKVLAWENIDIDHLLQVKGSYYSLSELLQSKELATVYRQGICIIIRLCPTDYHRFHFPDGGIPLKTHKIRGHYYSVNPLALKKKNKLYCENKRELTVFQSDNFGEMLLIEVGATCVGSIVQTYSPERRVQKGSEKGFFKFGGSTTIMILKKDALRIDDDILSNTAKGLEITIRMGERIGKR